MQGQPGIKAVDAYPFLGDLVTALCESPIYTTAAHETKNHMIKLALDKIGRADEVQWLECRHYREHTPDQLELLFATLFNKTVTDGDQKSIHIFNAARRAIDSFAFGTSTHPSLCPRVSPRLEEGRKRMREGLDASVSERSSTVTSKSRASVPAGSGSSVDAADLAATSPSRQPSDDQREYVPDGTMRVKHPLELLRYPDIDKITGLTEKLVQKINALRNVAIPFSFKNDHWVAMVDEAFMWMLHIQGSLAFSRQLRGKVHQLIFDALQKLEASPALLAAIKISPGAGWSVEVFTKQLRYRTHPPARGKKATMKRYGLVASTPYTLPLINEHILEWDGRTELTLEQSSLKAGDPGYEQLSFAIVPASNAQEAQGSSASLSFHAAAQRSSDGAGGSTDAPPAHAPWPPSAATSTLAQNANVTSVTPGHWGFGVAPIIQNYGTSQCAQLPGHFGAYPLDNQDATSIHGAGAGTMGAQTSWHAMPIASYGKGSTPEPAAASSGKGKGTAAASSGKGKGTKASALAAAPAPAPRAAAAPPPEPVRVIRAPGHLPAAVKQTLETLLIGKTVRGFQVLKDVNPEVEKDLCSLDAPYLVASVFQSGSKLVYYVGKPVAKHAGKLICWYPAQGQGTIETAGIFDQVEDIALAPTFVMKINAEDGATDDAKHGDDAQAAAREYTAEGQTTEAKKRSLSKDTLAWLLAKCKTQGEEQSQTRKRMVKAMTNIVINDPETVTELQKSM